MSAQLIDGKAVAQRIKNEIKATVKTLATVPGLAVILVGENPASVSYVQSKEKDSKEVGFNSRIIHLPVTTTEATLLKHIYELNEEPKVHGMLVQLPLPDHIDEQKIIMAIDPRKDVDGFHPINVGKLFSGIEGGMISCTPAGIIELLHSVNAQIKGKRAVIIGRSNIVGKPLAHLLLKEDATVTICHSKTQDLKAVTKEADILIAAVGKANLVTGDMVKQGAIVIDVGTNRVDGKLTGDIDFGSVQKIASFITPVPGGVGPMTRAMLLKNTLQAAMQAFI